MTREQVKWAMTHDWFRECQEIGFNITPIYKVRVSDGMLKWFSDYNELLLWVSNLNESKSFPSEQDQMMFGGSCQALGVFQ